MAPVQMQKCPAKKIQQDAPIQQDSGCALIWPELERKPAAQGADRAFASCLRQFLANCAGRGVSDITLQTDRAPRVEIEGRLYRCGDQPWLPSEIAGALTELYRGTHALAQINGRNVLDFSYELSSDFGERQRFRVNATGIDGIDSAGIEITIRILPSTTPDASFARLSEREIAEMTPRSGLVVIAGATGSGKSSTMAALIRHHLECAERPVKIVDIQAPIEFTYRDVSVPDSGSASLIGQSEVGRHVPDFQSGIRSALRRKPHMITVGESRDLETARSSLEAALTGHLVYTTVHAGSVTECVRRLISAFPAQEREKRAFDLAASLRFILVQHLLPKKGGEGRVPVKEYVSFHPTLRLSMLRDSPSRWPAMIERVLHGSDDAANPKVFRKTFKQSAEALLSERMIGQEDALQFMDRSPQEKRPAQ